ncbi:MAG: DNA mismatch repair protein MutS [Lachnospiraceae bacterium]|nr:DNA mismatch repair protein MutS [Lachnospiraceae bacterium]
MMLQYLETKEQYEDYILFYRLGDFYEMFFDDAITVSRELELTLTGKSCGLDERAPMCGVPFHAADSYISRLVKKGYKVAIGEQMEDPKEAKGLVKREVIRVVTPGTITDTTVLEDGKNNYVCCLCFISDRFGAAFCDVSTGDFITGEFEEEDRLFDELEKLKPSEVICNSPFIMTAPEICQNFKQNGINPAARDDTYFSDEDASSVLTRHFKVNNTKALGLYDLPIAMIASGALLSYLLETQKNELVHIRTIRPYATDRFLLIDSSSLRNLELVESMRDKDKKGSLLWVLDKTKTAMGARLLRDMIKFPLINKEEIEKRYDAIEELSGSVISRDELREYLTAVYDLERLVMRISYKTANPRDLLAFKTSLSVLPGINTVLSEFGSSLLKELKESLDTLSDLCGLIEAAVAEEPPVSVRDGDIIKTGFSEDVDTLRSAKIDGKKWLARLEEKERERTGIKNLKVKYNKVFGYYLEVTNSYKDLVPEDYIRKQTLANAERFYTPELKELENTILGADEKLVRLEYDIYMEILDSLSNEIGRIQQTANVISKLDVLASLSFVADRNQFVRPKLNKKGYINIKGGRHPVVEQVIPSGLYVKNDLYLDQGENLISIITGPNMAGKSTYMRQNALIVLMAQMGSFVPADSADISICDRIFTRVGASDDLFSGQSTFMVEMNEVANILRNATKDSLIILDEIGRGTSTFDGLAIAWAVTEYISDRSVLGAKTLFATHYHELTELEGKLKGVQNYCVAVKENGQDITFLRKIISGGADKSYGIEVARLAGVPEDVLLRAKEIANMLSSQELSLEFGKANKKEKEVTNENIRGQMTLFDAVSDADIIEEIKNIDVMNMTPMAALNCLADLCDKVNNRW